MQQESLNQQLLYENRLQIDEIRFIVQKIIKDIYKHTRKQIKRELEMIEFE